MTQDKHQIIWPLNFYVIVNDSVSMKVMILVIVKSYLGDSFSSVALS